MVVTSLVVTLKAEPVPRCIADPVGSAACDTIAASTSHNIPNRAVSGRGAGWEGSGLDLTAFANAIDPAIFPPRAGAKSATKSR